MGRWNVSHVFRDSRNLCQVNSQPISGQPLCTICTTGTYSDSPGSSMCVTCADGKTIKDAGATGSSGCIDAVDTDGKKKGEGNSAEKKAERDQEASIEEHHISSPMRKMMGCSSVGAQAEWLLCLLLLRLRSRTLKIRNVV